MDVACECVCACLCAYLCACVCAHVHVYAGASRTCCVCEQQVAVPTCRHECLQWDQKRPHSVPTTHSFMSQKIFTRK